MDLFDNKNIKPMLLKEIKEPFDSNDYLFELKFDGIRAIIYKNNNNIKIITRNGKDITDKFPELESIKNISKTKCIFDGEIIVEKDDRPSFDAVKERINIKDEIRINKLSDNYPATFIVFDILYEDKDLTDLPLIKRKEILNKFKNNDVFFKSKVIENEGKKLFEFVKQNKLEGIVAKKKYSIYEIGERSDNWLKIKNMQEEVFYICGYIEKENVLSVLLGYKKNNKYYYASKVILGRNRSEYNTIKKEKTTKNYLEDFKEVFTFIKPNLRATIMYLEKTKNNHLRHPIFKEITKNLQ